MSHLRIRRLSAGEVVLAASRYTEELDPPRWKKRVRMIPGRALDVRDFDAVSRYLRGRLAAFGGALCPGVVAGLEVRRVGSGEADSLVVSPGMAVDGAGRMLVLEAPFEVPVASVAPEGLADGVFALLLRPTQVSELAAVAESTHPCTPLDRGLVETDPLADLRWKDGVRLELAVLDGYPTGRGACARRLLNEAQATSTAQGRTARPPGKVFSVGREGVAIAVACFEGGRVAWLDQAMIRRRGGRLPAAGHTLGAGRARLVARARVQQFQEQLEDLLRGVGSGPLPEAREVLAELPPVGVIPARYLDLSDYSADAPDSGWPKRPIRFAQGFFPSSVELELAPIPESEVDRVVADVIDLAPIPLPTPSARPVRTEPPPPARVRLLLPLPDHLYDPRLLVREAVDPAFETRVNGLRQKLWGAKPLEGEDPLAPPAEPADGSVAGRLASVEEDIESVRAAIRDDDPDEPYTGDLMTGPEGVSDLPTSKTDVDFVHRTVPRTGDGTGKGPYDKGALETVIAALTEEAQKVGDALGRMRLGFETHGYRLGALLKGTSVSSLKRASPLFAPHVTASAAAKHYKEAVDDAPSVATPEPEPPSVVPGLAYASLPGLVQEHATYSAPVATAPIELLEFARLKDLGFVSSSVPVAPAEHFSKAVENQWQAEKATLAELPSMAFLGREEDMVAAPENADEAVYFQRGQEILRRWLNAIRRLEARHDAITKALGLLHLRLAVLEAFVKKLESRRAVWKAQLDALLHDLAVAVELWTEERKRVADVNRGRAMIITKSVRRVVFARARAATTALDQPELILGAALELRDPLAESLAEPGYEPEELRQAVEALRELPLACFRELGPALAGLARLQVLRELARRSALRARAQLVDDALAPWPWSLKVARVRTLLDRRYEAARRARRALADLDLTERASWSFAAWAEAATLELSPADLLAGSHGATRVDSKVTAFLEKVHRVAAGLYAALSDLPPALRLVWADAAERDDLDVSAVLRLPGPSAAGVTSVSGGAEVDPSLAAWMNAGDERERWEQLLDLQRHVDWIFGAMDLDHRVQRIRDEARNAANDLVRLCILLASHVPLGDQITATIEGLGASGDPKPGALLRLAVLERLPLVHVGMKVQLAGGAARGVVEDVDEAGVSVRLLWRMEGTSLAAEAMGPSVIIRAPAGAYAV